MIIGKCPVCGEDMRIGYDITNADRIRSMTDEELAELFDNTCIENIGEVRCGSYRRCYDCMLNWLKEEVKDGN